MRRMVVLLLAVVSLAGCESLNDLDRAVAAYAGGNLMFDTDKVEGSLNPAVQFGLNCVATGDRLGLWFDMGLFLPIALPYTGGRLGSKEVDSMFGINMKVGPSVKVFDDGGRILAVAPYFNFMMANAAKSTLYVDSSMTVTSFGAGASLTMYHTFGEMFSLMAGIDLGMDFYQKASESINDRELWEVSGNEIMLVVVPKLGIGMRL